MAYVHPFIHFGDDSGWLWNNVILFLFFVVFVINFLFQVLKSEFYAGIKFVAVSRHGVIHSIMANYFWRNISTTCFGAEEWYEMMVWSNGNIFHVDGLLWGKSPGHRWISLTKSSDAELWYFLCVPQQTVEQTVELPVIWGAMILL